MRKRWLLSVLVGAPILATVLYMIGRRAIMSHRVSCVRAGMTRAEITSQLGDPTGEFPWQVKPYSRVGTALCYSYPLMWGSIVSRIGSWLPGAHEYQPVFMNVLLMWNGDDEVVGIDVGYGGQQYDRHLFGESYPTSGLSGPHTRDDVR